MVGDLSGPVSERAHLRLRIETGTIWSTSNRPALSHDRQRKPSRSRTACRTLAQQRGLVMAGCLSRAKVDARPLRLGSRPLVHSGPEH